MKVCKNVSVDEEGNVTTTCPNGHKYTTKPIRKLQGWGYLYSSTIDFCGECEEPIDWSGYKEPSECSSY